MHAMDGLLLSGVPLTSVADALGTPTWVYSAPAIRARYRQLVAALCGLNAKVHYAVKANDHLAVLRVLAAEGSGADVVSGGELLRALAAGIPAGRVVFSGVGKSADEMRLALERGIGQINVESAEELETLAALATASGRVAQVALRVNPDIEAGTHHKISTGRAGDKFGIAFGDVPALYARAAKLPGLAPIGLAVHIGSQVLAVAPFRAAFARLAALVRELRAAGQRVESVDCGGGLGIPYRDEPPVNPVALAGAIGATLGSLDVRIALEPGRWMVGPAGVLLASVLLVKKSGATRFLVLDAAMNDLIRPAMYEAWHGIVPLSAARAVIPAEIIDVVGPVCETGDTFGRGRLLPALLPGAEVAILDAGAYGAVMSSTYNARPLAAAAMVDRGVWATIRPRQTVDALWHAEQVPSW